MANENTAVRTIVDLAPAGPDARGQWRVTSERIALDQPDGLLGWACARLPRELRAISEAAWRQALPGEAHRAICDGTAAGKVGAASR